jgi:hypothetical protein
LPFVFLPFGFGFGFGFGFDVAFVAAAFAPRLTAGTRVFLREAGSLCF